MAKKKSDVINLPVGYGDVRVGDKTCGIRASVSLESFPLAQADKTLCERRITGRIIAKPAGWEADQQGLPTMDGDDLEMSGVFDVKSLNVSGDSIGFGLTFSIKDVDVSTLAQFAKRMGRIVIDDVSTIPDGADSNGESEE